LLNFIYNIFNIIITKLLISEGIYILLIFHYLARV